MFKPEFNLGSLKSQIGNEPVVEFGFIILKFFFSSWDDFTRLTLMRGGRFWPTINLIIEWSVTESGSNK